MHPTGRHVAEILRDNEHQATRRSPLTSQPRHRIMHCATVQLLTDWQRVVREQMCFLNCDGATVGQRPNALYLESPFSLAAETGDVPEGQAEKNLQTAQRQGTIGRQRGRQRKESLTEIHERWHPAILVQLPVNVA